MSEKAGCEKTLSDCKSLAARLGGKRHWGFREYNKAPTECRQFPCLNSKSYTTTDPKVQEKAAAWWCSGAALHHLALETYSAWKARWMRYEVWGNPRRKHHAIWEEAESWASLDLTTGQLSQAYLKFHQGLVEEEVLEDSTVAITVAWLEPQRKYLVGFDQCLWGGTTSIRCIELLDLFIVNSRTSVNFDTKPDLQWGLNDFHCNSTYTLYISVWVLHTLGNTFHSDDIWQLHPLERRLQNQRKKACYCFLVLLFFS